MNSYKVLARPDIKTLLTETEKINTKLPKMLLILWPREVLGRDWWNGEVIVRHGECPDFCPENSSVILVYDGVGNDRCEGLGGTSLVNRTWGSYVGCLVNAD